MSKPKYGRGKFDAHPEYIGYMESIVDHPNYRDMPNARSQDGRINWQVSSGKTTSFFEYYLKRKAWWAAKADSLGLPGKDNENERFTVTARRIHPTGYRVCRLCGNKFNVGYFYINHSFASKLSKKYPGVSFTKGEPIDAVIERISKVESATSLQEYFRELFPERAGSFDKLGVTKKAFEETNYIRSSWLTPGFMGNPPDRLDGFHDYHFECRKKHDPGRFDDNMRSYAHDRRSFEWWAEGNWMIADALYNSASKGKCGANGCNEELEKVSPDHIGPLACGFKQQPLFLPTCKFHNSVKNRRFTLRDVSLLIAYEEKNKESVASWQVKAHWDKYKKVVKNDEETRLLSNSMRSLQDMYLRLLFELFKAEKVRFLATLLKPEYAFQEVSFEGLDPSNLTFSSINIKERITPNRESLAARTIRIAFEALQEYASKPIDKRKLVRDDSGEHKKEVEALVGLISKNKHPLDEAWLSAVTDTGSNQDKERAISKLFASKQVPNHQADIASKEAMRTFFDLVGSKAEIDFSTSIRAFEELL